ncbi:MAG: IS1634 family transposase [Erysipelotrichaceae bacterium]|nr:IS1634 family transposase [Erysipelotrichaceae bacterium]
MRINIVKSKNSEQVYIIKSFRKNGKSTSSIFKKLGKMEDLLKLHNNNREEVIAWANRQAKYYTDKENEDNLDVVLNLSQSKQIEKDTNTLFNGGYLFLKDIFYDLKLDKICDTVASRNKATYNLSHILEILIFSRILNPCSKLSSYEYAHGLIEKPDYDIQHVYRALSALIKEDDFIQSAIYKNSTKVVDRNTSVLYYDCTNYFFEIEQAHEDKRYGMSKEHRPNPIVQMGLFLDGNGIPLAFNITPGNANEQTTLKPSEEKIIRDFQLSKFVVCTDAELASKANRKFNNMANRSYVVTQSLKTIKDFLKDWALDPEGWNCGKETGIDLRQVDEFGTGEIDEETKKKMYSRVFHKERWINEDGLEQRLIVTYSQKYRDYQRNIRSGQIERATKMAKKNNPSKKKKKNDPARFLKEINTTENGEVASEFYTSLDQEAIDKEAKFDGFYGVCTTLKDDVSEIIKINQRRWEIEESFRIMKTEFKARPVYLERQDRIKAHFLVCYLSLVVFRILEKKLSEKYTAGTLIKTLRSMNFKYYTGYGYVPTYTRTNLTDELHDIFGFRTDTQIVSEKNMKKIIKKVRS